MIKEFEVLAQGIFTRRAVTVDYRPNASIRWEPPVEAWISAAWEAYVRTSRDAGLPVYNGTVLRLDGFVVTKGSLSLTLSPVDFRSYVGTGTLDFVTAFPHVPQANPLSVSVVLRTADGKIVVERRSRVHALRRRYHVIAGFMEQALDALDSVPNPFDALKREAREELALTLDAPLQATGLVRTVSGSELCFFCPLTVSFDRLLEIKAKGMVDSEIDTLEVIEDSPAAVVSFLASHPEDLVPSGRACLLLYGRKAYGEQWYWEALETASG